MKLKQLAIWLDQGLNVMIFNGYADETISARAYRESRESVKFWQGFESIINAVFFWQKVHCEQSYQSELQRRQLPPEYRSK